MPEIVATNELQWIDIDRSVIVGAREMANNAHVPVEDISLVLLYKLLKYNIGGSFYKIISSMYSNSICCLKDNYTRSEFFNYDKSVRQGCILSPLLFN